MAKQARSELQKAADRVHEVKLVIDEFEKIEAGLVQDVDNLARQLKETERNLGDTRSLLRAQREKLERELEDASNIIGKAFPQNTLGGYGEDCAKVNRSY